MRDTFHTFSYKDGFINTCFNRSTGLEEVSCNIFGNIKHVKSVLAAKQYITRNGRRRSRQVRLNYVKFSLMRSLQLMEYDLALIPNKEIKP